MRLLTALQVLLLVGLALGLLFFAPPGYNDS